VTAAFANADESMPCSAFINLLESEAADIAASAFAASVVCATALTVANRLPPDKRLPPVALVTVMSDSGMSITPENIVLACSSVGAGSTSHSEVTLNVATAVEPAVAFIPVRILLVSKASADVRPEYSCFDTTSTGTGVGDGVGGIGVGASEKGVTSINSVSLVSFMPIKASMSALLFFVTVAR